jgi:hypothetical protein
MSEQHQSSWVFHLLEFIVVILIAGLIVAIAIPNCVSDGRNGPGGKSNACINNLRQIDAAANQFALENHLTNGDRIGFPNDLTPYIKLNSQGEIPGCPSGGIYSIEKVGEKPVCSLGTNVIPEHVLP